MSDREASILLTKLQLTFPPPQCLLQRVSYPSKKPLQSSCGSQPGPGDNQPHGEDNLPARGGDVVILGVAAEEEKESWDETVGVQVLGSLLPSTPWGCP